MLINQENIEKSNYALIVRPEQDLKLTACLEDHQHTDTLEKSALVLKIRYSEIKINRSFHAISMVIHCHINVQNKQ